MQIGIRSSEEIEHFSLVKELNPNVFYFADNKETFNQEILKILLIP